MTFEEYLYRSLGPSLTIIHIDLCKKDNKLLKDFFPNRYYRYLCVMRKEKLKRILNDNK